MESQTSEKQNLDCSFLNSLGHTSKLMNMDLSMTPWYTTMHALTKAVVSSLTNVEVWLSPETYADSHATLNLFCAVLGSNVDEQRWEVKVPLKELYELIQLSPLRTLIEAMRQYSPITRFRDVPSTYTLFRGYHIMTSKKRYSYFGSTLLRICPQGRRNLNNVSLTALYETMKQETYKHWIVDDIYMDNFINHECGKIIAFCQCESNSKHWHLLCTVLPSTVRGLLKIRAEYEPKIKARSHPIQGLKIECINHFKNMYHYIMNNTGGHADAQNLGKQLNKTSHKHTTCCSTYSGILMNTKALTDFGFNHDLETCSCNWAKKQRFYKAMETAPPKTVPEEREKYRKKMDFQNKDYTARHCFPNWELNLYPNKKSDLVINRLFNKV
jgi:hypothetical protein